MEPGQGETSKNTVRLQPRKDTPALTLSSDFDSGNMARAEVAINGIIVLTPAFDCANTGRPSHSKGWFHFAVAGGVPKMRQKFIVRRMTNLSCNVKFSEYFKPVSRVEGEGWNRVEQTMVFTKEDDTELHFEYVFASAATVYFAYSFPFSYQECQNMLKNLNKQAKAVKGLYYKDEVMIKSPQGRSIHLLTVSSHDQKSEQKEEQIDRYMFESSDRCQSFDPSKRVVIVSARVHPGETPASHTFNGLLRFLFSGDARARFLLRNFVFKMVPMLNPDGVAEGHYRMDIYGNNLNRFYLQPSAVRQPSAYAMRQLGIYYQSRGSLCFYIDLHSHPQKKGNFIYGNALDTLAQQCQTQLFAKLLSVNCAQFDFIASSFSKHHMSAKDRNEDLTKQGCGRVVFNTNFNQVYAYTLECGYTCGGAPNDIPPIENSHRKFDKMPIIPDELENLKSKYYTTRKGAYFTIRTYQNLGKNIGVSILDLFQLNPASRVPNTQGKTLSGLKEEIATHINKISGAYREKLIRSEPANRLGRLRGRNEERGRIPPLRNSSITAKEIPMGMMAKPRNKTLAKVNIGLF